MKKIEYYQRHVAHWTAIVALLKRMLAGEVEKCYDAVDIKKITALSLWSSEDLDKNLFFDSSMCWACIYEKVICKDLYNYKCDSHCLLQINRPACAYGCLGGKYRVFWNAVKIGIFEEAISAAESIRDTPMRPDADYDLV